MNAPTLDRLLTLQQRAFAHSQNLTATAFSGCERMLAIALGATRTLLASVEDAYAVSTSANPTDALAAQAALTKPWAETVLSWGHTSYRVWAETSAELQEVSFHGVQTWGQSVHDECLWWSEQALGTPPALLSTLDLALDAGRQSLDAVNASLQSARELLDAQTEQVYAKSLGVLGHAGRKRRAH